MIIWLENKLFSCAYSTLYCITTQYTAVCTVFIRFLRMLKQVERIHASYAVDKLKHAARICIQGLAAYHWILFQRFVELITVLTVMKNFIVIGYLKDHIEYSIMLEFVKYFTSSRQLFILFKLSNRYLQYNQRSYKQRSCKIAYYTK